MKQERAKALACESDAKRAIKPVFQIAHEVTNLLAENAMAQIPYKKNTLGRNPMVLIRFQRMAL